MPISLDRNRVREHLKNFDLRSLFIEELGWDRGGINTEAKIGGHTYPLQAIAQKRGMVAFQYVADSEDTFPDYPTRQKIERKVAKTVREHLIVYAPHDQSTLYWQWVKREPGRPDRTRQHIYYRNQAGEALIEKLEQIAFTLEDENDLSIVDVSGRVRAAFDVQKVTKRFYVRFKKEHHSFLKYIEGIENVADREWYASLMLNRMMFIYFIQKRRFLDNNPDYLRHRLDKIRKQYGNGRFNSFYRLFLLKLFHDGLGQPEANRPAELATVLGRVPYLNGGLFYVHDLEQDDTEIHIPDEAFAQIFDFFDAYQWHLDDRPLRNDNEINPDVLGYIFEKYINQKQMGAYYTKEDITGYISRNTIIPFIFDRAKRKCSIAFKPGGGVWRLLQDDPDRYFYEAVRHGITYNIYEKGELEEKIELPPEIAAGLNDMSKRRGWNKPAPRVYALPTETWREHVARRRRYEKVHAKLAAGEVISINDLITYNLDIEKFAQDVIAWSEGPELIRAFWKAISQVSILDPTCGSGAFLFAALNILEPIYTACLESMQSFLDDLERSKQKHHPEKMSDFRKVLKRVQEHASERYFILKSIIIDNLYGVDIMEEAVEICKLRLFLKLVAQLDCYDQIEPLPDIDFNVRAGNTLVGFTTLQEIREAFFTFPTQDNQRRMLYGEDTAQLNRIEEDAEFADKAFCKFREMQTERNMDAADYASAKLDLRRRLDDLGKELDQYLAGEYSVKSDNQGKYENWRTSHQPFHWFVEFYGIMHKGGFNVIIGNPPYVEYRRVKKRYKVFGFATLDCGDLYAYVLERSYELSPRGRIGMILPVSIMSSDGFNSLRRLLRESSRMQFFQAFAERPSKLFSGVEKRLCVYILGDQTNKPKLHLSNYRRWRSEERITLFNTTQFVDFTEAYQLVKSSIPKIQSEIECRILAKLSKFSPLKKYYEKKSQFPIYYTRKARYFVQFFNFIPDIFDGVGNRLKPTELKVLYFDSETRRNALLGLLNSNLFFWFFSVNSDVRNLNRREIDLFPCSITDMCKGNLSTLVTTQVPSEVTGFSG